MAVYSSAAWVGSKASPSFWSRNVPVSFSGWIKMNAGAAAANRGAFWFGNNSGFMILFRDTGAILYVRDTTPAWRTVTTTYPTTSQWNHWAGTMDTNSINFYKNGATVGTPGTTLAGINYVDSSQFQFGQYITDKLDCSIEDFAIYSKVLSATELNSLASGVRRVPLQVGSLLAYWPFDEHAHDKVISNLTFADLSGNDNGVANGGLGYGEFNRPGASYPRGIY